MKLFTTSRDSAVAIVAEAIKLSTQVTLTDVSGSEAGFVVEFDEGVSSAEELATIATIAPYTLITRSE